MAVPEELSTPNFSGPHAGPAPRQRVPHPVDFFGSTCSGPDSSKSPLVAGVKWYAEGVFHRETVLGKDMSAKFVTPLVAGALIYNRLFAWKESFAVVGLEHAGLCVSSEFP